MLEKIEFQLPQTKAVERGALGPLLELLKLVPNACTAVDGVVFTPDFSGAARLPTNPATKVSCAEIESPSVVFYIPQHIELSLNGLTLRSIDAVADRKCIASHSETIRQKRLSSEALLERFGGHIVGLDHTGVNLPARRVSKDIYNALLSKLGAESVLYDYPEQLPWHFILPATEAEQRDRIESFSIRRNPKFELVWDEFTFIPVIQFDLETDLERQALEELLPEPYGFTMPVVSEYFRSVFLEHPWPNLIIRLDFRYWCNEVINDWASGRWLATKGQRHYG